MSQSLLLEVARQSIVEVLEASRSIDVPHLKKAHPLLNEKMATAVTLYLDDEIRSHYCSLHPNKSLIDDLIYTAKVAAFESLQHKPITTSEYLHVSIQVSILTPLKAIHYQDINDLLSQITPQEDGIIMSYQERESYLFPDAWQSKETTLSILKQLSDTLHIHQSLEQQPHIAIFQVQNAKDTALLHNSL
ncbi:MAG: AMMECR1 domain-containing protein [Campylobacterota bacterium]|nr:AMMECR1 domain-containing protein [Campylobacterota bacterium]